MIQGIKHIIFDLGGVILNIDPSLTQKAFTDLGIENFADIYSKLHQAELFDKLEAGTIGKQQFVATLQKEAGKNITEIQIINAWDAMLLDFPIRRMQILQQVRLHYDIFLLSNTNEIHEAAFNEILMRDYGVPSLAAFFDKVYLSHRLGMRKPIPEIYELVLNGNALKPAQTLFIDDNADNIKAAQKLGIQTIYLDKGMTIEDNIFKPKK